MRGIIFAACAATIAFFGAYYLTNSKPKPVRKVFYTAPFQFPESGVNDTTNTPQPICGFKK